jgi:fructuronate reductase
VTGAALSRGPGPAPGRARPAAPVRLIHLGLGNFFRAHPAWYPDQAGDAGDWGYAAFTGRSDQLATALRSQDGLYTLVTRAADGDRFDVVASLSQAYRAGDHDVWLDQFASADVRALTVTVTEAGYRRGADGGLDRADKQVVADVEALRRDLRAPVLSAPARILAGLAARRSADAGPIAVVPCDNLAENAAALARVVLDLAELVDAGLAAWLDESVGYVTTMVDRITPRTTPDVVQAVATVTGRNDLAPVVTEPFTEWVLAGVFPGGRPRWEDAGATFTADVTPYEQRKLWLLNGAHSLLAYAGSIRGHTTVAQALADDTCTAWLREWWSEAAPHLTLPAQDVVVYQAALLDRFANPRMRHRLDQIAADGSQKIPVRILPVVRLERAAGRVPTGACRILAAWFCHLRGHGAAVNDTRAAEIVPLAQGSLPSAVHRILGFLDPALADDDTLTAAVLAAADPLPRT